jgi:hypothetical protein
VEIKAVVERKGAKQPEEIVAARTSFTWAARTVARATGAVARAAVRATGLAAARHANHAMHGTDRVRFKTALGIS